MQRRFVVLLLVFTLCLGLSVPALASATPDVEIQWLELEGMPTQYVLETDLLVIRNDDGKYGMAERATGKTVVPCIYNRIFQFSDNGLALVYQIDSAGERHYGYLDVAGTLVIPLEYECASSFHEGLAGICKTDATGVTKHGFIDSSGKTVIPLEFDNADYFSDGLAPVERDGKWGCIDHDGNEIISFSHGHIYPFSDGLAIVSDDTLFQFYMIDTSGETVQILEGCTGISGMVFKQGLLPVSFNHSKKWGLIDTSGTLIVPMEYDDIWSISSEGVIVVENNNKFGYIDTMGTVLIPLEYDDYGSVSNGIAGVCQNDINGNAKWGLIDMTGTMIVPLEYDAAASLGQYCAVKQGEQYGLFENPYFVVEEPAEEEAPETTAEETPEAAAEESASDTTPSESHASSQQDKQLPVSGTAQEQNTASEPPAADDAMEQEPINSTPVFLTVIAVIVVLAAVILIVAARKKKAAKNCKE